MKTLAGKNGQLRYMDFNFVSDFVDATCSKALTDEMTLLDQVWPVSKDGIDFKVSVTSFLNGTSNGYFAYPSNAFDDDFDSYYHTCK